MCEAHTRTHTHTHCRHGHTNNLAVLAHTHPHSQAYGHTDAETNTHTRARTHTGCGLSSSLHSALGEKALSEHRAVDQSLLAILKRSVLSAVYILTDAPGLLKWKPPT